MDKMRVVVDLHGRAHTGLVVMRPDVGEERALLLLNVAETQARIRHLQGFLSASFLSDRDGHVLVEFLQWRSPEHVEAAFGNPAFHEHLPVVIRMAPHPAIAFGAPTAVLTSGGEAIFALNYRRYATVVFRVEGIEIDGASRKIVSWVRSVLSGIADAAIVFVDRDSRLIGALVAGGFAELPVPDLCDEGIVVVEHHGALDLYASIGAASDDERRLNYVMAIPG